MNIANLIKEKNTLEKIVSGLNEITDAIRFDGVKIIENTFIKDKKTFEKEVKKVKEKIYKIQDKCKHDWYGEGKFGPNYWYKCNKCKDSKYD